jgi:hypothetical protein
MPLIIMPSQICISIAALGLRMETWNTVIPDVVAACGENRGSMDALLQFLVVLLEEVHDGTDVPTVRTKKRD